MSSIQTYADLYQEKSRLNGEPTEHLAVYEDIDKLKLFIEKQYTVLA